MNIQDIKKSDWMIFEFIRGSHMYGLNTPTSDIDIGGVFKVPNDHWLSIIPAQQEAQDEKGDESFIELRKFLNLALNANPTVLEHLFVPKDCIKKWTSKMEVLYENRDIFITKKCYWSLSGYAYSQIKKARGQNKKVYVADKYVDQNELDKISALVRDGNLTEEFLQHKFSRNFVKYLKRKIVFPIQTPVGGEEKTNNWHNMNELISDLNTIKPPTAEDFCNNNEYNKAQSDYNSFWEWMANKNDNRWTTQESKEMDYDAKNMMHTLRLLMEAEHILEYKKMRIRWAGAEQRFLMDVRMGRYDYKYLLDMAESKMSILKKRYDESDLPNATPFNAVDQIYKTMINT